MNTPTKNAPARMVRAADDARERAIALLTDRYAEGVIDDDGLEARLERLYAAATTAEVDALVADLRAVQAPAPTLLPPPASPRPLVQRRVLAIMSETKRTGRWIVSPELRVVAFMSDVKLDLRTATLPPHTTIDVSACMAAVRIVVPPGVAVIFDVGEMMGVATSNADEPQPGEPAPVVHVVGSSFMAEVKVQVKLPGAK